MNCVFINTNKYKAEIRANVPSKFLNSNTCTENPVYVLLKENEFFQIRQTRLNY